MLGGLSPRVWGSPLKRSIEDEGLRSIPTCVGQPFDKTICDITHRVYPHVCGAASGRWYCMEICRGLSPRVWGSLDDTLDGVEKEGSIPTCVGQPRTTCQDTHAIRVYPHVCGAAPGYVS